MREILFRAWDKEKKVMTQVWEIGFKAWDYPDECINYIKIQRDGCEEVNEMAVILLQYTGLKDKNGKEIFEGDIVKSHGIHGEYVGEIVWERIGFKMRFMDIVDNIYPEEILEVKGNIYENSELLMEKKK